MQQTYIVEDRVSIRRKCSCCGVGKYPPSRYRGPSRLEALQGALAPEAFRVCGLQGSGFRVEGLVS